MNKLQTQRLVLGSIICLIGALFYCYEFILRIVPGILQNELTILFGNISASTFGQISALYYFAYSPMQLPVGILMDRYGPKKLLTIACLCCTLGSLMFSYPTYLIVAGCGRFLVGFGSAFAFVGVLSLALNWLPYSFFSTVAGLMTTLGMMGLVYGEIKLTELTYTLSLPNILLSLVILGAIITALIFFIIRDNPNKKVIEKASFTDLFINFSAIIKTKEIWMIGVIGACLYTSLSVFGELWGKSYLENAHNLTNSQSAKTMSMLFIGWAIGAPVSGFISDKFNNRILPLLIGAVFSFFTISIVLYKQSLSYSALNFLMFTYGIFSSTEILVFIMAKEYINKASPSTIFAVTNMIVTLAGAILQPLVGTLLDIFGKGIMNNNVYIYSNADYSKALTVIPGSLILTILILLFLNQKTSRRRDDL